MTSQGPVRWVSGGSGFSSCAVLLKTPGDWIEDTCRGLKQLVAWGWRREAGKQARCSALQGRLGVGRRRWGQDKGLGSRVC